MIHTIHPRRLIPRKIRTTHHTNHSSIILSRCLTLHQAMDTLPHTDTEGLHHLLQHTGHLLLHHRLQ